MLNNMHACESSLNICYQNLFTHSTMSWIITLTFTVALNCQKINWHQQGILPHCYHTSAYLHKTYHFRPEITAGKGTGRGVQEVEGGFHDGASLSNSRPRQEDARHLWLCYRKSTISEVWGWEVETNGLYLKISEPNRTKLQDFWQGDDGSN